MRMKYQHTAPVLDCAYYVGHIFLCSFMLLIFTSRPSLMHTDNVPIYLQDPTHSWSGGLDAQLKMHDLNTDQGMLQTCKILLKTFRQYYTV